MNISNTNLIFHRTVVQKEDRQLLNGHKSCVIWLTGLSGSGKSTIAMELDKKLFEKKIRSYVLDGDNIRHGLNNDLGFSEKHRKENIRRVAEVAKLFVDAGFITIAAFISPYQTLREKLRSQFAEREFFEVYVECPLEECIRRDPKGLYYKADLGQIFNFTAISDRYEAPLNPEVIVKTNIENIDDCVVKILNYLGVNNYI
jgi:adenylylsulfate kinase